jgi:enamine deaminase RidA (YjgF/YER057c/UK114 family)
MGFKIYSPILNRDKNLAAAVQEAMQGVPCDSICGIVFYGTTYTEYHQLLLNLQSIIFVLRNRRVPITLVPQYLLPEGGLAIEIYTLEEAEISIKVRNNICYGIIENDEEKMLFFEGIPAADFSDSVSKQSKEVFDKVEDLLSTYGFEVDDIVRQWNYIGSIVSYRDGKQNYQEFNDARSLYYAKGEWKRGYPAATGIGAVGNCIIVGGIAFKRAKGEGEGVYPIDNPLQIAAHVYSKKVLIDDAENAMKSTPKFERAKLIESERGACCFVSGTAAIRGEESMDASSAKLQTIKTLENIEYLVSKENLVRFGCKPYDLNLVKLQVFVKNKEDYNEVKAVVEERYPHVQTIYTIADVCRSELLVEIEGILIS